MIASRPTTILCALVLLAVAAPAPAHFWYADVDAGGHGDPYDTIEAPDQPLGYVDNDMDCDDTNPNVHPAAMEVCDLIDNDCNELVDDYPADGIVFYQDLDRDGYGSDVQVFACEAPGPDWSTYTGDCDDWDPNVNPDAEEICDMVDNDCDSQVDEPGAVGSTLYFQDIDADGFGSDVVVALCEHPGPGWSDTPGDCNDENPYTHPGAEDVCDGIDNDCDDIIDDGMTSVMYWQDNDEDGYGETGDDGVLFCWDPGPGWVQDNSDCDDGDYDIHPGAVEVCDGVDNDCSGMADDGLPTEVWYPDVDADGYGDADDPGTVFCDAPGPGWMPTNEDCDDTDPDINPDAVDVCDGLDNDCDGVVDDGFTMYTWYPDVDGDGYGDADFAGVPYCEDPGPPWILDATDCDDGEATVYPGAPELWDDLDNDCDGVVDDGHRIAITDVGNDQGRQVRVNWPRHAEDAPGTLHVLTGYSLYRRIDEFKSNAEPVKSAPPGFWDYVSTVPAHGEDEYYTLAQTLGDSTTYDIVWSVFFLRAETTDPLVFFDSPPDSGYSVDNLAPPAPGGLQAASVPGGTALTWIESQGPDVDYYRIYRGAAPDFPVVVNHLINLTTANAWTDPQVDPSRPYYKVTAIDLAGNESLAALVESTTGVGGDVPRAAVLHPNRPNPFNPITTFAFEVPREGRVTLTIHSLDGHVVARVVDEVKSVGAYTAVWRGTYDDGRAAPSGVYLARYLTGDGGESRRVTLVR
ncbi:hypothetical protein H8E07_11750 [bacterium]|nr:hypothetical protein [bacterium]